MQKRIILFTIGSIQEFIMHSKKVRDLYNSSRLMIELVKLGMDSVQKYNGEIILPVKTKGHYDSIPNYFIAEYKLEESIGSIIEEELRGFLYGILKNAQLDLDKKISEQLKKNILKELDIYWVEYLPEEGDNYSHIYNELYKYLDGVKRIRQIEVKQIPNEKCTMCGIRNPLVVKSDNTVNYIEKKYETSITSYNKLGDKEMLCGICLCKRLYKSDRIPSLAEITQSSWANIQRNREKYKSLAHDFKNLHMDKDFAETLYKEKWVAFERNNSTKLSTDMRQKVEELHEQIIPKFYCLYRFDIDDLGMYMHTLGRIEQQEISKRINEFYAKVRQEFDDTSLCLGKLIYAGGDDLLALVPVEQIFLLLDIINNVFGDAVGDAGLTYSQSIHIVHYTMPLREVIRYSKGELDQVKKRYAKKYHDYDTIKDGTVISIFTEGYNSQAVFFRNSIGEDKGYHFLMECMHYFKHKSTYFHYTLEQEFRGLDDIEEYDIRTTDIVSMLFIEQERMMKRYAENKEDTSIGSIHDKLRKFFYTSCMVAGEIDVNNYYNWFHIIRRLNGLMDDRGRDTDCE